MRPDVPPECAQQAACLAKDTCWRPLLGAQIQGYATEHEAVDIALECGLLSLPCQRRQGQNLKGWLAASCSWLACGRVALLNCNKCIPLACACGGLTTAAEQPCLQRADAGVSDTALSPLLPTPHRNPRTVDALLAFHSLVPTDVSYSIRTNHTAVSRPESTNKSSLLCPLPRALLNVNFSFKT